MPETPVLQRLYRCEQPSRATRAAPPAGCRSGAGVASLRGMQRTPSAPSARRGPRSRRPRSPLGRRFLRRRNRLRTAARHSASSARRIGSPFRPRDRECLSGRRRACGRAGRSLRFGKLDSALRQAASEHQPGPPDEPARPRIASIEVASNKLEYTACEPACATACASFAGGEGARARLPESSSVAAAFRSAREADRNSGSAAQGKSAATSAAARVDPCSAGTPSPALGRTATTAGARLPVGGCSASA